MREHTWEDPEIQQIWTVNQANQNDWSKETRKKCLIKVIQTATRARFSDSVPLSLHMCLSTRTLFLPNNTLFYYILSLWEFFSDLVARILSSHHHDPAQFPAGIPSPAPSCCRLRLPEIISIVRVGCCCLLRGAESFQLLLQGAALPIWSLLLWYSV